MEGAQVEAVRAPAARRLADVQPDPLADLVGDRLTGPAEVAVDLEVEERLVVDHALARPRAGVQRSPSWKPAPFGIASSRCMPMSITTRAARNACAWSMPMRSPGSSR